MTRWNHQSVYVEKRLRQVQKCTSVTRIALLSEENRTIDGVISLHDMNLCVLKNDFVLHLFESTICKDQFKRLQAIHECYPDRPGAIVLHSTVVTRHELSTSSRFMEFRDESTNYEVVSISRDLIVRPT